MLCQTQLCTGKFDFLLLEDDQVRILMMERQGPRSMLVDFNRIINILFYPLLLDLLARHFHFAKACIDKIYDREFLAAAKMSKLVANVFPSASVPNIFIRWLR